MRKHQRTEASTARHGAMMVLVVLCLPVVLAFAAFAINIAYMQLTRTELRTATDAAVRAGSRELSLSQDVNVARSRAIEAASKNSVAGTPVTLSAADVTFGNSTLGGTGKYSYTALADTSNKITGVSVTARRTASSADGAIPMLFQEMFDTGTFEPVKTAVASQIDRDVFLVLDRSGSMNSRTPGGSRWKDLKKAVKAFFDTLKKTPQREKVGVATYSTDSQLDERLNFNYGKLQRTINGKRIAGWTAIGLGMRDGMAGLKSAAHSRKIAAKTLVVMTDGNHNRGVGPETVAREAARDNITVHTITFSSGADKRLMREVARLGGGKHWHADDQAGLIRVFEEVANNLPTLITE